jgi:hypothetical protein
VDIRRRDFLAFMGAGAMMGLSESSAGADGKPNAPEHDFSTLDGDPIGGYVKTPARSYLFTDYRIIDPGDLRWLGPDGSEISTGAPGGSPVQVAADASRVPYGIRLVAQKASAQPLIDNQPRPQSGQPDNGVFRSFQMRSDAPLSSTARTTPVTMVRSESTDGFHWKDTGTTKLQVPGGARGENGFFIDDHGPANERYKFVYLAYIPPDEVPRRYGEHIKTVHPRNRDVRMHPDRKVTGLYLLTSPDGLNWTTDPEPLMIHFHDTLLSFHYDEWIGKYVLYTRMYITQRRIIAIAESYDFRHWEPVRPLVWPGLNEPFYMDIYTNGATTYPGMPEVHLMFPMFYNRLDQSGEVRMYSSIDGLCWSEIPGGPVIDSEIVGQGMQWIGAGNPLIQLKDKIALTYFAYAYPHKYPRWQSVLAASTNGYCWWDKGRLAAVTADEQGEFCTFPIAAMGKGIKINARTKQAGSIRVGVVDRAGRSIAQCDPFTGDSFDHRVTWKGDPATGVTPGEDVALRFFLRKAELFGFEWVD